MRRPAVPYVLEQPAVPSIANLRGGDPGPQAIDLFSSKIVALNALLGWLWLR